MPMREILHILTGETALDAFENFFSALDTTAMFSAALRLVAVLLCLTVHETCHGLAAYAIRRQRANTG